MPTETSTTAARSEPNPSVSSRLAPLMEGTGEADHGSLDVLGQHVAWCAEHEVTKARHWAIDADGYPTECVECLAFREAWAEWRLAHPTGVDTAERASA